MSLPLRPTASHDVRPGGARRNGALHLLPRPRPDSEHGPAGSEPSTPAAGPDLDPTLGVVYRYAVDVGDLRCPREAADHLGLSEAAVEAAVAGLLEHRLLRAEPGTDRLRPVDPEVATALLVTPMEREIHQRQEQIARIRHRTSALREAFVAGRRTPAAEGQVQRIEQGLDLPGHLRLAAQGCRRELRVLLGARPEDGALDDLPRLCAELAARGVDVRIVTQHRSRADLRLRTALRELTEAGVTLRTVTHVPRAAIVFDREVAVLLSGGGADPAACRVSAPEVVGFLLDLVDHLWDGATPLASVDTGYAEVAGDLRQTMAGLMAKGFTDEVLARKLGMSLRTCRRHISSLMRELDSVSRFQAGVAAAQRHLVEQA